MPGNMTGRELAVELQLRKPGLAVIFVSGYSAEIAGRELSMGARQTFLQKPFQIDQLLSTIHRFMQTRGQA
jgi:FixJ family two-component response regulator